MVVPSISGMICLTLLAIPLCWLVVLALLPEQRTLRANRRLQRRDETTLRVESSGEMLAPGFQQVTQHAISEGDGPYSVSWPGEEVCWSGSSPERWLWQVPSGGEDWAKIQLNSQLLKRHLWKSRTKSGGWFLSPCRWSNREKRGLKTATPVTQSDFWKSALFEWRFWPCFVEWAWR